MMHRIWQSAMIGLARSKRLTRFMQDNRAGAALGARFTAGGDVAAGVARAEALIADQGLRSSLFYLGEYVEDPEKIAETLRQKRALAHALGDTSLDMHISVDPTQIGQMLDPAQAVAAARGIAAAIAAATGGSESGRDGARNGINRLMIDMEDGDHTETTIALYDALAAEGLPVALTLQAHLRRTQADLARVIEAGGMVRLVKGAFVEPAAIAYTTRSEIKENYRRLIRQMFSPEARAARFYPVIASHDDRLHDFARAVAREAGWTPGTYEFEMLLGVRGDQARALAAAGERVRLYAPFGKDWFPYAVRRIGENPRNVWLLGRALLGAA